MTERQAQAWQLREEFGWPIERIARQMGIRKSAVSRLLGRAKDRRGRSAAAAVAPGQTPRRIRWVRPISLSQVFDL